MRSDIINEMTRMLARHHGVVPPPTEDEILNALVPLWGGLTYYDALPTVARSILACRVTPRPDLTNTPDPVLR